jgi:hypothetical protein
VTLLSNPDEASKPPQAAPRYRSWADREAERRAAQEKERQALSQRIQASRDNRGVDERERARRRHEADIQAFRSLMMTALETPSSDGSASSPRGSMSSLKLVCALIAQRAQEDPSLLEPEQRKTLGFHYRMIGSAARWIVVADQLAEHARAGVTREITARGPFAGLRVSTRAVVITSGIEDVAQLRTAIATGTIALDQDIAGDGLTRRRWVELLAWLTRQPA